MKKFEITSLKALLAKPFARQIQKKVSKWANNPIETQDTVFKNLISEATSTLFGKDHDFININSYEDYVKRVPIRNYEDLKPYISKVVAGEKDILWKGKPIYFATTSGTTSGAKYIPITKESMPNHTQPVRNAILLYVAETGKTNFVNGKMIFLQGSPVLEKKNGIQKKVARIVLEKKKFRFKYHTHFHINSKGKTFHFIYDLAWMEFSDDEILIVRKR